MADITHMFGGQPFELPPLRQLDPPEQRRGAVTKDRNAATYVRHAPPVDDTSLELAEYASAYARAGFRPLALEKNSKVPVWNEWSTMAPSTPEAAQKLLGHHRGNIGITFPSDLFALDLDRKGGKDGIAAMEDFAAPHGGLPQTLTQRTPSGSEHRIFRKPPDVKLPNRVNVIARGIDVRSEGGQIACEPSMIDGKTYQWLDWSPIDGETPEIADAPAWLLNILAVPAGVTPAPSTPGAKLLEGGRNDALFRDASAMRRRGFDGEAISAALIVRNRNDCSPPLPDGDVRTIAASATKYEPEGDTGDWLGSRNTGGGRPPSGAEDAAHGVLDPVESLEQNLIALENLDGSFDPLPHCVERWIPNDEVTLLAGHGGGGKSFVALSIAVHVVLGLPFGNLATTQASVLFFSCEDGQRVLRRRLARICHALKIDPSRLVGKLYLLDASDIDPALHREQRAAGRNQVITVTPLLEALAALVQKLDVGLVIVDNASDVFDDDEIKRQKVRAFIRSLRSRIARPGRAVLLLAHINKVSAKASSRTDSESYSGSTAWHNSVRSRLSLIPAGDDAMIIEHAKANHGAKAASVRLEWQGGVPLVSSSHTSVREDVPEIVTAIEKAADDKAKAALVTLIEDFDKRGEPVTTSFQGSATVYKLLKTHPLFPKGTGPDRLTALLRELETEGRIYRRTIRTAWRKPKPVFTCVPEPESAPIPDAEAPPSTDGPGKGCAD
ncbi:MAG: AAA family ATPase [Verrucomicrobia bacterium]|nr:AAA family ATPase [Verrucomicrobiota bacterium]